MSATPGGTMNGRLRSGAEQRGAWLQQRVQDLRAAQVTGLPAVQAVRSAAKTTRRPATAGTDRAEAA